MTNYLTDLTWSGQFYIITYPEIDLSLIICHLTYLTKSSFRFNFLNEPFESTYVINLFIKLAAPLACGTLFLQQTYVRKRVYSYLLQYVWFGWLTFLQIAHSLRREMYHPRAPLGGSVDESLARRNSEFSLMRTLVLVFYVRQSCD